VRGVFGVGNGEGGISQEIFVEDFATIARLCSGGTVEDTVGFFGAVRGGERGLDLEGVA
jgi:hypothetical protein